MNKFGNKPQEAELLRELLQRFSGLEQRILAVEQKLLTTKEAAEIVGYSSYYIRQICSQGLVDTAQKDGRAWFIPRETVNEWVKNNSMPKLKTKDNMSKDKAKVILAANLSKGLQKILERNAKRKRVIE